MLIEGLENNDPTKTRLASFTSDGRVKTEELPGVNPLDETNSLLRRVVLGLEILLNQELPDPKG